MTFGKISDLIIRELQAICGKKYVLSVPDDMASYGHDETEDFYFMPAVVVKPQTTSEISKIMALCYKNNLPVTPRGGGTGLSGGALPVFGGVLLSIERMDAIIGIDEKNFQVTTQAGVITQVLQEAVMDKNLFYPPDPSSRGTCFIGGNIAENSGGPKAVKYGVVKDYVLNLEMVLPNGEVIWTGANVLKNATGYNLTQLVVGSEGTLGVITTIVLKLIPLPRLDRLMLVPFRSARQACEAVTAIMQAGITPSALEFMERDALEWTMRFVDNSTVGLPDDVQAHLLIEVDGNREQLLEEECEQIFQILEAFDTGDIYFADNAAQKEALWSLRRKVAEAVKAHSIYKEEDTVVPRAALPDLLEGVKKLGAKYGFKSVCYGHAGDGNLHVNIIKGDMDDDSWKDGLNAGIRELFELTKSLGGTISGEHGIGFVQKNYMDIVFDKTQLNLMRAIKSVFDPRGLMNPGKIFPTDDH